MMRRKGCKVRGVLMTLLANPMESWSPVTSILLLKSWWRLWIAVLSDMDLLALPEHGGTVTHTSSTGEKWSVYVAQQHLVYLDSELGQR